MTFSHTQSRFSVCRWRCLRKKRLFASLISDILLLHLRHEFLLRHTMLLFYLIYVYHMQILYNFFVCTAVFILIHQTKIHRCFPCNNANPNAQWNDVGQLSEKYFGKTRIKLFYYMIAKQCKRNHRTLISIVNVLRIRASINHANLTKIWAKKQYFLQSTRFLPK